MMPKAKKVSPPVDMDAHNAARAEDADPGDPTPDAPAQLTTAEVAEQLDTTPRTLRKFLRSKGSGVEPVGQGKRYEITAKSLPKLAERFDAWKAKADARAASDDAPADEVEDAPTEDVDHVWTPDELEEFTVAELRDLILDSMGVDRLPAKGTKKAKLIDVLTS